MDAAELQLQKDITAAFILADAVDVVLERSEKLDDGAGGFKWSDPEQLAPQTARMIPNSDRTVEVLTSDGRMANPQYTILLPAGADVERYDQFLWNGKRWEIAEIHDSPAYELKGDVVRGG